MSQQIEKQEPRVKIRAVPKKNPESTREVQMIEIRIPYEGFWNSSEKYSKLCLTAVNTKRKSKGKVKLDPEIYSKDLQDDQYYSAFQVSAEDYKDFFDMPVFSSGGNFSHTFDMNLTEAVLLENLKKNSEKIHKLELNLKRLCNAFRNADLGDMNEKNILAYAKLVESYGKKQHLMLTWLIPIMEEYMKYDKENPEDKLIMFEKIIMKALRNPPHDEIRGTVSGYVEILGGIASSNSSATLLPNRAIVPPVSTSTSTRRSSESSSSQGGSNTSSTTLLSNSISPLPSSSNSFKKISSESIQTEISVEASGENTSNDVNPPPPRPSTIPPDFQTLAVNKNLTSTTSTQSSSRAENTASSANMDLVKKMVTSIRLDIEEEGHDKKDEKDEFSDSEESEIMPTLNIVNATTPTPSSVSSVPPPPPPPLPSIAAANNSSAPSSKQTTTSSSTANTSRSSSNKPELSIQDHTAIKTLKLNYDELAQFKKALKDQSEWDEIRGNLVYGFRNSSDEKKFGDFLSEQEQFFNATTDFNGCMQKLKENHARKLQEDAKQKEKDEKKSAAAIKTEKEDKQTENPVLQAVKGRTNKQNSGLGGKSATFQPAHPNQKDAAPICKNIMLLIHGCKQFLEGVPAYEKVKSMVIDMMQKEILQKIASHYSVNLLNIKLGDTDKEMAEKPGKKVMTSSKVEDHKKYVGETITKFAKVLDELPSINEADDNLKARVKEMLQSCTFELDKVYKNTLEKTQ